MFLLAKLQNGKGACQARGNNRQIGGNKEENHISRDSPLDFLTQTLMAKAMAGRSVLSNHSLSQFLIEFCSMENSQNFPVIIFGLFFRIHGSLEAELLVNICHLV